MTMETSKPILERWIQTIYHSYFAFGTLAAEFISFTSSVHFLHVLNLKGCCSDVYKQVVPTDAAHMHACLATYCNCIAR